MSRLPSLSEYEMTSFDDYENMQSGSWDKGRGTVRHGSGTGEGLRMFSGTADQCGTCHLRSDLCEWQVASRKILDLPTEQRPEARKKLGAHPR